MVLSIYTSKPLLGPKCAKASAITCEKIKGEHARPNGKRLNTHFRGVVNWLLWAPAASTYFFFYLKQPIFQFADGAFR